MRIYSFVKVPRYLIRNWKISLLDRMFLMVLASYCWKGRECWPSGQTIAQDMGVDVRTVWRCAKSCEKQGLIKRRPQIPGNKKSSTVYTLTFDNAAQREDKLADPGRSLVTPQSPILVTPESHEVEEVLKGSEDESQTSVARESGPTNILPMPVQRRKVRYKA